MPQVGEGFVLRYYWLFSRRWQHTLVLQGEGSKLKSWHCHLINLSGDKNSTAYLAELWQGPVRSPHTAERTAGMRVRTVPKLSSAPALAQRQAPHSNRWKRQGRAEGPERGLLLILPTHHRHWEQEFTRRLPCQAPYKARGVTFTTLKSALRV